MRAIDADALLEDCKLVQKGAKDLGCEYASSFYSSSMELSTAWWCVEDLIENAPTIEPERKRGEWKHPYHYGLALPEHQCSVCGEWEFSDTESNFCPNCGADMRGDKNDDWD